MSTKLELTDRRRRLIQLRAQGASLEESLRLLGIQKSQYYAELKAVQAISLERVRLNEDAEHSAIDEELTKLEAQRDQVRRVLNERTEPGSQEYAAMLRSWTALGEALNSLRMDLGVWRRAAHRLVTVGSDLSELTGAELDAYIADLDSQLSGFGKGKRSRRGTPDEH